MEMLWDIHYGKQVLTLAKQTKDQVNTYYYVILDEDGQEGNFKMRCDSYDRASQLATDILKGLCEDDEDENNTL